MMAGTLSTCRRLLAGGFCGALSRYGLSLLIQGWLGKSWPFDMLIINLTGALALAFVKVLADATGIGVVLSTGPIQTV